MYEFKVTGGGGGGGRRRRNGGPCNLCIFETLSIKSVRCFGQVSVQPHTFERAMVLIRFGSVWFWSRETCIGLALALGLCTTPSPDVGSAMRFRFRNRTRVRSNKGKKKFQRFLSSLRVDSKLAS